MNGQRRDNRQDRQWVKVQLGADDESRYALDILTYWKSIRAAARLIRRAIIVYYELKNGNLEPLYMDFPGLRFGGVQTSAQTAPAETTSNPTRPAIKRFAVAKSSDEDIDDLLSSLGI